MAENVSAPSCRALFLSVLLLGMLVPRVMMGQANVQGQWSTLPNPVPINPIHVALLPNGKVLIVAGSGNLAGQSAPYSSGAALYNPPGTFNTLAVSWDMFCNGMVLLPDGRAFINGGTKQYDPFLGSQRTSIFNSANNAFIDVPNMAHGRWYPTVTTLGDGRVMTFSGLNDTAGNTNTAVEIYDVGPNTWSQEYGASWIPPLYPWMHLLPTGKVFYSGPSTDSRVFDPSTHTWTNVVATTNYPNQRTYGSSVLLPLTPVNDYDAKVMILGGSSPATATTEIIDLGTATNPNLNPTWAPGPDMSQPRIEMNAVILPNGKVLAMGGSKFDEDYGTLSLNADLYNSATNTFSSAAANAFGRLYHSVALLLPDATVWLAGGNPVRGQYEQRMEIYKPAYLFQANGTAAIRPSISSAPSSISWGNPFTVQTPDAANIASVVLVRNGAATHAFNMDQRLVGLSFTAGSGALSVTAPRNGNIAPPGYYMLFILNNSGVPSVARFVRLVGTAGPPLPDVIVTSLSYTSGVFTSTVKNQGTAATPAGIAIGVGYSVDGVVRTWGVVANPPLAEGQSATVGTNGGPYTIPNGTHTITANVDDVNRFAESDETNNLLSQSITVGGGTLPDVIVTSLSYASGVFTSTVKNQGTAATPSGIFIGVGYSVDGVQRTYGGTFTPLAAGASVTIGTDGGPYTIPNGTHTITAYVDDVNRFAESNETNNQLSQPITVGGGTLPDVIVTSLSYASGVFTSTVKNQGTAATPSGIFIGVGYSVDGLQRTYGGTFTPLAAGASVTIGTDGGPYTIPNGTHTITAYVDDVNRFAESNETNNQLSQPITVP